MFGYREPVFGPRRVDGSGCVVLEAKLVFMLLVWIPLSTLVGSLCFEFLYKLDLLPAYRFSLEGAALFVVCAAWLFFIIAPPLARIYFDPKKQEVRTTVVVLGRERKTNLRISFADIRGFRALKHWPNGKTPTPPWELVVCLEGEDRLLGAVTAVHANQNLIAELNSLLRGASPVPAPASTDVVPAAV